MSLIGELKNNVDDCNIGDYIKIGYIASQNAVGSFFVPNDNTPALDVHRKTTSRWFVQGGDGDKSCANLYPNAITPNGYFYGICIGKEKFYKIFIPDRIIQNYISYNSTKTGGLIDGLNIETTKFKGYAKIMSYEEIQSFVLPTIRDLSSDYRYDFGVPALSFTIGGGNNTTWRYAFNTYDNVTQTTNIEMTLTLSGDNVRYIADYEGQFDSNRLLIGEEHGNSYGDIYVWQSKDFTQRYTGDNYRISVYYRSAIRPLLYLKGIELVMYTNDNNIYSIQKEVQDTETTD